MTTIKTGVSVSAVDEKDEGYEVIIEGGETSHLRRGGSGDTRICRRRYC